MFVPLNLTTQPLFTLIADVLLGVLFGVLIQGAWSCLLMSPDTPFIWMYGRVAKGIFCAGGQLASTRSATPRAGRDVRHKGISSIAWLSDVSLQRTIVSNG